MLCKNCEYDMGDGYINCGASQDGVCPECGQDDDEEEEIGEVYG